MAKQKKKRLPSSSGRVLASVFLPQRESHAQASPCRGFPTQGQRRCPSGTESGMAPLLLPSGKPCSAVSLGCRWFLPRSSVCSRPLWATQDPAGALCACPVCACKRGEVVYQKSHSDGALCFQQPRPTGFRESHTLIRREEPAVLKEDMFSPDPRYNFVLNLDLTQGQFPGHCFKAGIEVVSITFRGPS